MKRDDWLKVHDVLSSLEKGPIIDPTPKGNEDLRFVDVLVPELSSPSSVMNTLNEAGLVHSPDTPSSGPAFVLRAVYTGMGTKPIHWITLEDMNSSPPLTKI